MVDGRLTPKFSSYYIIFFATQAQTRTFGQTEPRPFLRFVSHQWLGSSHPDPEFLQLPVLQKALRKLIAGETMATSDLASQFLGDTRRFSQQERKSLSTGYIWMDWFSIPQATFDPFDLKDSAGVTLSTYSELEVGATASALRSPTGTTQDLYVSSIPFYVEVRMPQKM